MRNGKVGIGFIAFALLIACVGTATAGPYSDAMGKCMVSSTSVEEKGTLVRWIFAMSSLHPAVASISAVTDAQRTELSKATGALFEALLTDRCKTQTQEALKYEGTGTLQASFGLLGQAAMMELMTDKAVSKGFEEFANYVDKKKLEALLEPSGAAAK